MASSEWDNFPVIAAAGAAAFVGVSLAYLAWSTSRPTSSGPMPTLVGARIIDSKGVSPEMIRQIMDELSPLDSLYLDVSLAKRDAEAAQYFRRIPELFQRAVDAIKGSLAPRPTLDELTRSFEVGYITQDEYNRILEQISDVLEDLNPQRIDSAAEKLNKLQSWIGEKFYRWVIIKAKLKGL